MPLIRNIVQRGIDVEEYLASLGRVMIVNFGSTTTPLTFAAAGGIVLIRPHAWIRVPADTSIIPFRVTVQLEDSAGTDNEVAVMSCANDVGNGTSSAATAGPLSTSVNQTPAYTSLCTARQLATADVTALTDPRELDRWVYPFADATTDPVKKIQFDLKGHRVAGAGSLLVHVYGTTTAPAGYVQIKFGEVPSSWVNG